MDAWPPVINRLSNQIRGSVQRIRSTFFLHMYPLDHVDQHVGLKPRATPWMLMRGRGTEKQEANRGGARNTSCHGGHQRCGELQEPRSKKITELCGKTASLSGLIILSMKMRNVYRDPKGNLHVVGRNLCWLLFNNWTWILLEKICILFIFRTPCTKHMSNSNPKATFSRSLPSGDRLFLFVVLWPQVI